MCFMRVLAANKSGHTDVLKWENDSTSMIQLKGKSFAKNISFNHIFRKSVDLECIRMH
jgi:hypothetical protein